MDDYLAQGRKMQIRQGAIDRRITDSPFGPASKEWASRWLRAEAWGQENGFYITVICI